MLSRARVPPGCRPRARRAFAFAAALPALLCIFAVSACGSGSSGLQVVAAENFYGSIATQVAGARVRVTSIIRDPAADPHLYASNAQDTLAVADARLVIVNGAGYDPFMERLLASTPTASRTVIHVDRLVGARGADPNPHLWYAPGTPVTLARTIASDLSGVDPRHATAYRRNASRFIASLAPIDAEIASLRRRFAGVPFAYTERVPGYLTSTIGLALKTPEAFSKASEAGTDPPPQSVATMRSLITGHRIRLLLYNSQASSQASASIRDLAGSDGIPVVGVSETSPPGQSYEQWQLGQLHQIDVALSAR